MQIDVITLEEKMLVTKNDSLLYNLYIGKVSAMELNTIIPQMFEVSDKKIKPHHLFVIIFRNDDFVYDSWYFEDKNKKIDIQKVKQGDKVVLVFDVINQPDENRLSQVGSVLFEVN